MGIVCQIGGGRKQLYGLETLGMIIPGKVLCPRVRPQEMLLYGKIKNCTLPFLLQIDGQKMSGVTYSFCLHSHTKHVCDQYVSSALKDKITLSKILIGLFWVLGLGNALLHQIGKRALARWTKEVAGLERKATAGKNKEQKGYWSLSHTVGTRRPNNRERRPGSIRLFCKGQGWRALALCSRTRPVLSL